MNWSIFNLILFPLVLPTDVMRWLEPQKLIRKQTRSALRAIANNASKSDKSVAMLTFYLRVKFYVTG
jgi:hypothetical protein